MSESSPNLPPVPTASADAGHACRWCGRLHRALTLARGERASCTRCGGLLAHGERPRRDVPIALALTGLICLGCALLLPVITAEKFGSANTATLFVEASAAWRVGFQILAVAVVCFAVLAPMLVLTVLIGYHLPDGFGLARARPAFAAIAHGVGRWSMPEVHVLAFVVAFAKLGDLVNLSVNSGLWFYAAGALMSLLALQQFESAQSHARKQEEAVA